MRLDMRQDKAAQCLTVGRTLGARAQMSNTDGYKGWFKTRQGAGMSKETNARVYTRETIFFGNRNKDRVFGLCKKRP